MEERILVLTTHNKDGECECVTQDGCHANDSCAICNVGMTRRETIDKMAKALVEYEKINNPNACEWTDLKERAKEVYRGRAEYVLDALLEGK